MRRLVVLAFVLLAATAGSARAAAPRIVILSGGPLPRQVVIANWRDIFVLTQSVSGSGSPIRRSQLARRPRIVYSMFWGPSWIEYLDSGSDPAALRPADADQTGSFYPAWNGRPAAIDLPWAAGTWPCTVPPRGLAILRRYGVVR
jgi:hypothetical protein